MEAEVLILTGLVLIFSGSMWLLFENRKVKKIESESITEIYARNLRKVILQPISYGSSLVSFLGGIYFWWLGAGDLVWTVLAVVTMFWFLKAKKSIFLAMAMWMVANYFAYIDFNFGLIWLLTVIGVGYFDATKERGRQNIFSQVSVLINPIGSVSQLAGNKVPVVRFEELPSLKAEEIKFEGLVPCPVCQEIMKQYSTKDGDEKIIFDKCPKCNAVFFDEREHMWAIAKTQDTRNKIQETRYKKQDTKINCPRCEIPMKHIKNKFVPVGVNIYSCRECMGNLAN